MQTSSYSDPSTMDAARQRVHQLARELPSQYSRFDDETEARPANDPLYQTALDSHAPYSEEPFTAQPSTRANPPSHSDVALTPKYDTDAYPTGNEDSGARKRPRNNGSYDAAAYEANYPGVRKPIESVDGRAFREPANEPSWAPEIPLPPKMPDVPANFVMGVQPIRSEVSGASMDPMGPQPQQPHQLVPTFPPPRPLHGRTPMMGVPYSQPIHAGTMAASPRAMHSSGQQMHIRAAAAMSPHGVTGQGLGSAPYPYSRPVGPQLTVMEEAQQGSKVGRFTWFVFGAAFGIFFAFCAMGFLPRLGKKEEATFPPPAPLPTQLATQQQAPAPPKPSGVASAKPPTSAPPVTSAPASAPTVPAAATVPPTAAPPPSTVAAKSPAASAPAAPAPPPAVASTSPRGQRSTAVARKPPAPSGPKALPNSGSIDSDDGPAASAPAASAPSQGKSSGGAKSGGGDASGIGDLLNAGLGSP